MVILEIDPPYLITLMGCPCCVGAVPEYLPEAERPDGPVKMKGRGNGKGKGKVGPGGYCSPHCCFVDTHFVPPSFLE